jgi:hypothetical protein
VLVKIIFPWLDSHIGADKFTGSALGTVFIYIYRTEDSPASGFDF